MGINLVYQNLIFNHYNWFIDYNFIFYPKTFSSEYVTYKKLSMSLLKAVWNKNLEVRPEKDWELDKGRAVI